MQLKGLPGTFYRAGRLHAADLSPTARERLKQMDLWETLRTLGLDAEEAARRVGVPRATLYRWRKRLQRSGPQGLEEGSRAPKRRRRPTWRPCGRCGNGTRAGGRTS